MRAIIYIVAAAVASGCATVESAPAAQAPMPSSEVHVQAQSRQPSSPSAAPGPAVAQGNFSVDKLDEMVAPIALYPDTVLIQVLIASTYPLEIVEAARWQSEHKDLQGEA